MEGERRAACPTPRAQARHAMPAFDRRGEVPYAVLKGVVTATHA
jgi:hypothetical protein